MKYLSVVFAVQCFLLSFLLLDFNDVVYCQAETGALLGGSTNLFQMLLAHLPAKLLGVVQVGLLARLLRNRRNRLGGPNGVDDDRDGQVDEEDEWGLDTNKKNVMIFMGKHNIQVSNHGIQNDEEESCTETDGDCDDDDDDNEDDFVDNDDDDDEDGVDDDDEHGDKYKKDKYKKDKGDYSGDDEEGDKNGYKKAKKTKTKKYSKKSEKKTYTKTSYGDNEDNGDNEESKEGQYNPTFLAYANSNNKPTQLPLFPWLKNLLVSNNDKTNNIASNGVKDSNIMSSPNGFPIGGSKLDQFSRRSGFNKNNNKFNSNVYLEDIMRYQPSESEINELLSNPQVIDFLYNLNKSLSNETNSGEIKRNRRQVRQNDTLTFTAEESRKSNHFTPMFNNYGLKVKNSTKNYVPHYLQNRMHSSQNGQRLSANDMKSESSVKSLNHINLEPQESSQKSIKTYKLGDYVSFKPLDPKYKTSSSMNQPSFDSMSTDDDDEYPMRTKYSSSQYSNDMPTDVYGGVNSADLNKAYGGLGSMSGVMDPNYPIMDLSYWSQIMKKTDPIKTQKKYKKKYVTTEKPTTQSYEDDDDEDEEEEDDEQEEPSKKVHTTIQVIKSGSKTGNIGINNKDGDEDRSIKGWVKGLPGFRSLFGKR